MLRTAPCWCGIAVAAACAASLAPCLAGSAAQAAPGYLAEILFRDDDGVLFLAQAVLPKAQKDDFSVAAIAFGADGKYIAPPDVGHMRREQVITASGAGGRDLPAAERTHLYGVCSERADVPVGQVEVRVSDMGRLGPLPQKPGEPTFVLFFTGSPSSAVFRFEILKGQAEPLRQDIEHWRKRTKAIAGELLARRAWVNEDERRLAAAAHVLRDPGLIGDLHDKLEAWVDRGEDWIRQTGFPHHLLDALVAVGPAQAARLMEQIAARPRQAHYLVWKAARFARRVGLAPTRDLLLRLLDEPTPMRQHDLLRRLREREPSVPEPVCGDGMLLEIARAFRLDPAEFGMAMVEQRLLDLADRHPLSAQDADRCQTCVRFKSGTWIMPSAEARKRGVEAMKVWVGRKSEGGSP